MVSLSLAVALLATITTPGSAFPQSLSSIRSPSSSLLVNTLRDADFVEMMVGGERYEMVPLPDSMLDTTLFVGNLNEFTKDEDLSKIFSQVTTLSSVPAVVVRKANMASLHYGFVTFPSVQEKEAAIMRFHGSQFMGKKIKVEEIKDHAKKGRVKVPERMVSYVSGGVKKTSSREVNTMRRVTRPTISYTKKKKSKQAQKKDVRNFETFKLSDKEQSGFQRAIRSGFVTLDGTGFRRGRKTCNLACAHRDWCDVSASKPQIILCKASGGRPLDSVIVDLSPLRSPTQDLELWKDQIAMAALSAGMELRSDYVEDNCLIGEEESYPVESQGMPISNLPVISMGVYEGERSKAKAMARELASLWDLPSDEEIPQQSMQQNSRKKQRGGDGEKNDKRKNNKRRRNQRNEGMDFFF